LERCDVELSSTPFIAAISQQASVAGVGKLLDGLLELCYIRGAGVLFNLR
jgi:hypothetical protein